MAKASGDAIGAAKARYQGLSETLEVQKQKVEQLKRERQDMQQTIRESATVTKEQTDDLNKLDRQLASASNKLNSLSNQQERAKRSFEDVYKRQELTNIQNLAKAGLMTHRQAFGLMLAHDIMPGLDAVSYTHLDVYKRQEQIIKICAKAFSIS